MTLTDPMKVIRHVASALPPVDDLVVPIEMFVSQAAL
jgi:hypothetical protein